jgi:Zn-dependent M16 (insulinase) family peptidase
MEALRILTPEQSGPKSFLLGFTELSLVRKYHASYYVPHNLALIVAGKLTEGTSSLLRVVQEQIEPSLIQHKQNKGSRPAGWKRPFVETPSAQRKPILVTTKSLVEFPEKDESMACLT